MREAVQAIVAAILCAADVVSQGTQVDHVVNHQNKDYHGFAEKFVQGIPSFGDIVAVAAMGAREVVETFDAAQEGAGHVVPDQPAPMSESLPLGLEIGRADGSTTETGPDF